MNRADRAQNLRRREHHTGWCRRRWHHHGQLGSTEPQLTLQGAALFSDGYANAVISPVNTVLARLYPDWMDSDKTENRSLLGSMGFAGSESEQCLCRLPPAGREIATDHTPQW